MTRFPMFKSAPDPRSPHELAAEWLLREEAGRMSGADRARLDAWLDSDNANRAAWADVHLAVNTVIDHAAHPELMALRADALAATGPSARRSPWPAAAAAALLAVLVAGGWFAIRPAPHQAVQQTTGSAPAQDPNGAVYRTAVGERAAITLPDGSVVTLDTDSVLKVAYTSAERGVRLIRGQALFEVAKHRPRPFQVYAATQRITAVGTRFDVRLSGPEGRPKVTVALVEGVVQVAPIAARSDRSQPSPAVTMAAGEVLTAAPSAPVRVASADTERLTSWRSGVLTFDDVPLDQAVAEMNRYTTRPIVLADPTLARLHVSGVFRTGDPEHFAETLAEALPVRVAHGADGAPSLEPRS